MAKPYDFPLLASKRNGNLVYAGKPHQGAKVSCTLPSTIDEALKPGPDTNGKPYFPSQDAILSAAIAQLRIAKGHAANATALEEGKTLADVEKAFREAVMGEARKSTGKKGVTKEAALETASDDELLAILAKRKAERVAAAKAAK